jgi:hypothetical protein
MGERPSLNAERDPLVHAVASSTLRTPASPAFRRTHTYQIRQAVPLQAYAGELSGIVSNSSTTAAPFTTASAGIAFAERLAEHTWMIAGSSNS